MKKRFLSIVLAVLMLVSVLPISALAADVEPPIAETGVSTKISENTTGPKLEKSAQWVDEKAGIAKITIKVTGEQPTQSTKKTDIVLVIDRSLSMTQNDRDWLKNAKKAAKAFAKKILNGEEVEDYVAPEVPADTKDWLTTFLLCFFHDRHQLLVRDPTVIRRLVEQFDKQLFPLSEHPDKWF